MDEGCETKRAIENRVTNEAGSFEDGEVADEVGNQECSPGHVKEQLDINLDLQVEADAILAANSDPH